MKQPKTGTAIPIRWLIEASRNQRQIDLNKDNV